MILSQSICIPVCLSVSDGWERTGQALALFASYLESAQLKLQVLLFIQQLLQSICKDDIGVVQATIFLVELVVLIVLHASRHAVIGCHVRILLMLLILIASMASVTHGTATIRHTLLLMHPKHMNKTD